MFLSPPTIIGQLQLRGLCQWDEIIIGSSDERISPLLHLTNTHIGKTVAYFLLFVFERKCHSHSSFLSDRQQEWTPGFRRQDRTDCSQNLSSVCPLTGSVAFSVVNQSLQRSIYSDVNRHITQMSMKVGTEE